MTHLLGGGLAPGHRLGERDLLLAYLARQRELVLWKLDGLDDDAARAVSTPSGLTVHGIVRHLENVERSWWRQHVAGET
ncbi:MAG: mycothiol transferase, partial [Mycobacteriales bacterium]